jgi:hypothetical protein
VKKTKRDKLIVHHKPSQTIAPQISKYLMVWCISMSLALIGLLLWLYAPGLNGELLNWDDDKYLTAAKNPILAAGWRGLILAWTQSFDQSWYPILQSYLVLASQVALWSGIELITLIKIGNLLLAVLSGLLMLRITVFSYGLHPAVAFVLVALFWVHPLRIETVVWAANVRDSLSLLFILAALQLYLMQRKTWMIAALLASLSKTAVCLVPFGFPLIAMLRTNTIWCRDRQAQVSSKTTLLIWLIVVLGLLGAGIFFYRGTAEENCALADNLWQHLATVVCVQVRYFARLFDWQPPLAVPTLPLLCTKLWFQIVSLIAGIALLMGVSLLWWKSKARIFTTAFAWWLLAMLPVMGIIPLAFPIAERYTLLPLLGFCLIAAAVIAQRCVLISWAGYSLIGILVLAILGLSLHTRNSINIWISSQNLWAYNIKKTPNEWAVQINAGGIAGAGEDFTTAKRHLELAWALAPYRSVTLSSLFLARAIELEPKLGVYLYRSFLASRNNIKQLNKLLDYPFFVRHSSLIELIEFRIRFLTQNTPTAVICNRERKMRWLHHPQRKRKGQ